MEPKLITSIAIVAVAVAFTIFVKIRDRRRAKKCQFSQHNAYVKHYGRCTACGSRSLNKKSW